MVTMLDERHVTARDLRGGWVAHSVRQLASNLLVGNRGLGCLGRVARGLFGGMGRNTAFGAGLGFYPRGTVGDVEVLLGVVLGA